MSLFHKLLTRLHTRLLSSMRQRVVIGNGSRVDYRVEIGWRCALTMGERSILYKNVTIYAEQGGAVTIGSRSHIAPYGYLLVGAQKLVIGDDVAIGPFCALFCVTNAPSDVPKMRHRESYRYDDIRIGNNVFIGAHSVVLPGTVVEDNVVIAANSTLSGLLESGWLYGGNPARPIRELPIHG